MHRAELPFPELRNPASAGFLIGDCRPKNDYRRKAVNRGFTLTIGRSGVILISSLPIRKKRY
jgi:hypothetical protein